MGMGLESRVSRELFGSVRATIYSVNQALGGSAWSPAPPAGEVRQGLPWRRGGVPDRGVLVAGVAVVHQSGHIVLSPGSDPQRHFQHVQRQLGGRRACGAPAHDPLAERVGDERGECHSPDRTHHVGPRIDEASDAILDQALASLGPLRGLTWVGDAAITVHLLASLQRQGQTRLPDAVADARGQDYSWAEIGDLLGLTRAAAWHRYGRPGRQEDTHPVED